MTFKTQILRNKIKISLSERRTYSEDRVLIRNKFINLNLSRSTHLNKINYKEEKLRTAVLILKIEIV
jgi:hypothetical protein